MDGQNFQNEQNYYQETPVEETPVNNTYHQYQAAPATVVEKQSTDAKAVVALVMGILSIVGCCCYGIGAVPAIVGLILAIMSKKKNPSGIATAGLVCSIIGLVFSVIAIIYFVAVFAFAFNSPEYTELYNEIYNSYY